ncbi:MAG: protein-export protein SecB [alpha proteobacterium HIMB114]|nr:MAG: protein-export protein SecB [alpha proteobacterium HIMB114]
MSETNNQIKYEVVAKYIKDISFEIPSPECFVSAAENLGSYSTKLDLTSKPFKNNLAELNCKFLLEAPENLDNKIHAEVCISIVFKLTDPKMTADEIKKTILVSIPSENFAYMKDVISTLFQKSGFKNFNFNKPIDFEDLYKQQFSN